MSTGWRAFHWFMVGFCIVFGSFDLINAARATTVGAFIYMASVVWMVAVGLLFLRWLARAKSRTQSHP